MIDWLKLLSARAWLEIGIALALVAGAVWIGHAIDVHNKRVRQEGVAAGRAEVQSRWDQAEKARAEVAAKAEAAARAEEQRRLAAQQEIIHANELAVTQARADASAARDAAARLRERVAAILASAGSGQAGGNPAAVTASAPADDAIRMCADLLGRADARLRVLAQVADEAHAAGQSCERSYDSLTPP